MAAVSGLKGIFAEMLEPYLKKITAEDTQRLITRTVTERGGRASKEAATRGGKEAAEQAARQGAQQALRDVDDFLKFRDEIANRVKDMKPNELDAAVRSVRSRPPGPKPSRSTKRLGRPSQAAKEAVNDGVPLTGKDPVLPSLDLTGTKMEADHIYPKSRIMRMDGFDQLSREQKRFLLQDPDNFMGLSKRANSSKGDRLWEEWTHHKSTGAEVNPVLREEMIRESRRMEVRIQAMIDYMVQNPF